MTPTPNLVWQLSGAIPGLLRRGSPVTVISLTPEDCEATTCDGSRLRLGDKATITDGGDEWVIATGGTVDETGPRWTQFRPADVALDLADPTGRFHALLWLKERGHDLAWAEGRPEVLAWSVLSVSRGGKPIVKVIPEWRRPYSIDNSMIRFDNENGGSCCVARATLNVEGLGWWFKVQRYGESATASGPEIGEAGKALADAHALAHALAHNYALLDGETLILPELP